MYDLLVQYALWCWSYMANVYEIGAAVLSLGLLNLSVWLSYLECG